MTTFTKIPFATRAEAQAFGTAWAFHTRRGYGLSATRPDGTAEVELADVTESDREWIEAATAPAEEMTADELLAALLE